MPSYIKYATDSHSMFFILNNGSFKIIFSELNKIGKINICPKNKYTLNKKTEKVFQTGHQESMRRDFL